ncbi:fungal-specific transcription factor domain-containing protein [Aspergillus pseudoustus]|uniref:Fungal-specific transcription factor domain-containing protein n=1 Tax=Aspergillus pseudoustus TaxID=1810923 RepID=A0ABR4IT94_9EURO
MTQHRPPRKACDLCYRKKIKCDAQRPRCSHCIVYDSACTFAAASRKARAEKKRQSPNEGIEALQSRMKQLEKNLSQALEKIDQLEGCVSQEKTVASNQSSMISSSLQEQQDLDGGEILDFVDGSLLDLPPLHEALPAVEKYLATLNSVIPLFHPGRLLNSLRSLYAPLVQRHRSTWAAINVVLALAHSCHVPSDQPTPTPSSINAAHYLNKAQSVLTEVIMGEADIVSVQILLGLAMLFQGSRNLKPAAMLIAIALRLAHELGLHDRRRSENLNRLSTLERDRVFWIAYIIDRDISMRTKQPPIQLETDLDIDLPSVEPEDGAGLAFAADSSLSFNFFRARVQLASIQGRVYEILYSVRAQTLNVDQRNDNLAALGGMLDDWASQIPSHFRPNAVLQSCDPDLFRTFGILYSTHLSCRALICRAHAMETRWLQSLQDFGAKALQRRMIEPVLLLPQGWQVLVNECREYMRLFTGIERKDPALIWMTGCTYVSGSICLIANNMLHPNHETLEYDQSIAELSLLLLEEMIQQEPYEPLRKVRNACSELLQLASRISLQNGFLPL